MMQNEMKNNSGKRMLVAIIATLMIVCAVAVVATPSEAADTTFTVDGTTDDGHYATLDAAVEAATGGETIILPVGEEYSLSKPIDVPLTIKSGTEGTTVNVSITAKVVITASVTFNDLTFSDGYGNGTAVVLLDYNTNGVATPIVSEMNNVSFTNSDENSEADTVYVEALGANITINMNDSLFNGVAVVYAVTANNGATINFNNTKDININFSSSNAGEAAQSVTIGNNGAKINVDSESTINQIWVANDADGSASATIANGANINANKVIVGTELNVAGNLSATTIESQDQSEPTVVVETGGSIDADTSTITPTGDTENVRIDNIPDLGPARMPLSDSIIAVYEELNISGEAYISGTNSTLVIPEGKTLRIMSGGNLDMSGNTLIVEGELIIEPGATVSNGGTIVLVRGGTFDNAGTIGVGEATEITAEIPEGTVDVTYTGIGSVSVSNVSGMEFGFVNTTGNSDKPQYTLTISGDLIAEDSENNSISVDGARIVGDLYVGQDVTLDIQNSEIRNGTTITVDGTLASNGNLTMYNGSEIAVNGQMVGAVKAVTGDYQSRDGENGFLTDSETYTGTKQSTFEASATGGYITGYTLSVGTYAYQKTVGENNEAWTSQRLYVSGSMSYGADYTATQLPSAGTVTITGNGAYVAADVTLVLPNGINIVNTSSPVTVLGTIQFTNMTVPSDFNYIGASYNVKTTGTSPTTTGYVTTFPNAMAAIATADQQKVTVKGDLDIDAEYTLTANQRLDLTAAGDVVIKNGGSLTLEGRSIMTGDVDKVEGVMTIMKPNGSNAPLEYSTIAQGTTADGVSYTRYSGLQYALDNATAGETITVVGETEIEGNLTIPAGVTVSGENTISIGGNLVIEETAKLEMIDANKLQMTGDKSKVTVNGTLDVIDGAIEFTSDAATTDTALTSTVGITYWGNNSIESSDNKNLPDAFNTVAYYDENNQIVMTSPEAAIAAASSQDVNKYVVASGNVTAGDIELTVNMLVRMDANVTLGTVTLAEGISILVNDEGRLTADITAQTGVDGGETASTVQLDGAANIAVGETDVIDSQNVTTHQMYIAGTPTGSVTVSEGTVVIGNGASSIGEVTGTFTTVKFDKTGNTDSSLTVSEGATLQVNDGMTLESGKTGTNGNMPAVVIDGTLAVSENGNVTVSGIMDVNGTMTVADNNTDGVSVTGTMNVTGTLQISQIEDEEASVDVTGTLVVGEKITTMGGTTSGTVTGTVTFTDNGSLKAYNGASLDGAIIGGDANGDGVSDAKHTGFFINGNPYMTVYADDKTIDNEYLQAEDFALTGYDMTVTDGNNTVYDIEDLKCWYKDAEMTQKFDSSSTTVGTPEAVYFKVNASNVDVRVSIGSGISLYIDNVRYNSGDIVSLAVGTHTVNATVNPGYSGDVTVQFNGQTVSGEFTITPEMASNTYEGSLTITATGDITQDSPVINVDGGNNGGSDGLGLTDYLLIILVILIVIMAIIVALRLMRS